MHYVKGSDLPEVQRRRALACYVHRYTKDHFPQWAASRRSDGSTYPVQFASDAEWLANTEFLVTEAGELAKRESALGACVSYPTWPDNPELRADTRPRPPLIRAAAEVLVYVRGSWEIAHIETRPSGRRQWVRRDGSWICDHGTRGESVIEATADLPPKPERVK